MLMPIFEDADDIMFICTYYITTTLVARPARRLRGTVSFMAAARSEGWFARFQLSIFLPAVSLA